MALIPNIIWQMARAMVNEEQIKYAMNLIAEKKRDVPTLMYDMQNSSSVKHDNADLHEWLAGLTDYGYTTLIERLKRS